MGNTRIARRRLYGVVIALVVAVVGCSNDADAPTTTVAEGDDGSPRSGGTLVFARQQETTTLNPHELADNGQIYAHELIFDTLVRADSGGSAEIVPGLAESWESSADGLDWTFTLRENATFSNGDAVTSEDVQFSLDRFADPEINTILPFLALGYESTEIVDDRTFIVHLDQPVAAFLWNISIFSAYVVPKALVEAQGDAFWDAPVGSGPFKLKEWDRGSSISFEPNEFYWEEGKPYVDELRYEFVVDDNTRILKLQSGEAGVMESVPFSQIEQVSSIDEVDVQVAELPRMEPVWLNHNVAPLDELAVRKALSMAIDREAINTAVYGDVGRVPNHLIPELKYNSSDVASLPYDVEAARAVLAESSVPDGFEMTLQFPAGSSVHRQLVTILQSQWAEIGVDVTLEEVDESTLADNLFAYEYEMSMPFLQWTSDVLVPDEFALFFTDLSENGLDGFFTGWANEAIWDQVQIAVAADEPTREQLWPQIQQAWVDDEPWINVLWLPAVTGLRDSVHGIQQDANGVFQFQDAWVD